MTKEKMDFTTVWQGNAAGKGYMEAEHFNLDIALPPYYGGRGGEAEPKGMLIASATACYIMTLASFLSKSKIPVNDIKLATEATVRSESDYYLLHKVEVVLENNADNRQKARADRLIIEADERCPIGNLLKKTGSTIEVEGKVTLYSDS